MTTIKKIIELDAMGLSERVGKGLIFSLHSVSFQKIINNKSVGACNNAVIPSKHDGYFLTL